MPRSKMRNAYHHSNGHLASFLRRVWTWIESGSESLANLLDTTFQLKFFMLICFAADEISKHNSNYLLSSLSRPVSKDCKIEARLFWGEKSVYLIALEENDEDGLVHGIAGRRIAESFGNLRLSQEDIAPAGPPE
jgi:hypothetical protein